MIEQNRNVQNSGSATCTELIRCCLRLLFNNLVLEAVDWVFGGWVKYVFVEHYRETHHPSVGYVYVESRNNRT